MSIRRAASALGAWLLVTLALGCTTPDTGPKADSVVTSSVVTKGAVTTGAERLLLEPDLLPSGVRVGLIVNHTSVTSKGHLIDILDRREDITIAALFGPEHGIRGKADAGTPVGDGHDPATGAPIYSLYGETRQPTPAMLKDVDLLLYDIQDVGARFYTYISTMGLAMQAAARDSIPFVVLDRPNPLGGKRVDGYVLEPGQESFVGMYPIPIQHGLTVGELARMIQGEAWMEGVETLDLRVISMKGWARSMLWPETGLAWIAPSPNLPSFEAALLYTGTCFIEATTASEGRGTDAPFLTVGAPWIPAEVVATELNSNAAQGLTVSTGTVVPRSIPGASTHPKWEDTDIETIQFSVTSPHDVRPLDTGMALLAALTRNTTDDHFLDAQWLRRLAGTERLYADLQEGRDAAEIVDSWRTEVDAFRMQRAAYLLYE